MSHYLYQLKPKRADMLSTGPRSEETAMIQRHFDYLEKLLQDKVVLMAGRTTEDDQHSFGLVIFEASTAAKAANLVANDPAVKHGLMSAQLYPYRIALWRDL